MAALLDAVNRVLASGQHKEFLQVIKGFRNGAVYGAKVRFPHALVMTFLFKGGSLTDKFHAIFKATYTHSRNLALFVMGYKALTSTLSFGASKSHQIHNFLSAFCVSFIIFGKYNKVNEQINLYLLSRVIYALAKLAILKGVIKKPKTDFFPWFAAIVWGATLFLFEYEGKCLQPSLKSSLTYIYKDSEKWTSLRDFLIYNR